MCIRDRTYGVKQAAPRLQARRMLTAEAFWSCVIAPEAGDFSVTDLRVRHGEGCTIATVTGETSGRRFVDRLLVHWEQPGLVVRPDYQALAPVVLERRIDGALAHLLVVGAEEDLQW